MRSMSFNHFRHSGQIVTTIADDVPEDMKNVCALVKQIKIEINIFNFDIWEFFYGWKTQHYLLQLVGTQFYTTWWWT